MVNPWLAPAFLPSQDQEVGLCRGQDLQLLLPRTLLRSRKYQLSKGKRQQQGVLRLWVSPCPSSPELSTRLRWKPWPLDTLWLHWQPPGGKGDADGQEALRKQQTFTRLPLGVGPHACNFTAAWHSPVNQAPRPHFTPEQGLRLRKRFTKDTQPVSGRDERDAPAHLSPTPPMRFAASPGLPSWLSW